VKDFNYLRCSRTYIKNLIIFGKKWKLQEEPHENFRAEKTTEIKNSVDEFNNSFDVDEERNF
jgi:hypothetical protein